MSSSEAIGFHESNLAFGQDAASPDQLTSDTMKRTVCHYEVWRRQQPILDPPTKLQQKLLEYTAKGADDGVRVEEGTCAV